MRRNPVLFAAALVCIALILVLFGLSWWEMGLPG